MTDINHPPATPESVAPSALPTGGYPPPPPVAAPVQGTHVAAYGQPMGMAPLGKIRSTGICILLTFVTLGIYPLYWYFVTHEEMKRHSGQGLGGLVAFLLAFFIGIVMPFISSSEVGALYTRRGQAAPVSGATGLWYFPGMFILVGPFIWFIQTNGALNDYWRSQGAN